MKRICCHLRQLATLHATSCCIILTASRRYIHQMVGARVAQPRRAIELRLAVDVFRYLCVRAVHRLLLRRAVLVYRLSIRGAGVVVGIRRRRKIAERVLECPRQWRDVERRISHRWFRE